MEEGGRRKNGAGCNPTVALAIIDTLSIREGFDTASIAERLGCFFTTDRAFRRRRRAARRKQKHAG